MSESELVTLTVAPSLTPNDRVEIRVVSSSGLDGDENLILGVRWGFYLDDGSWTESAIDPEESRVLWRLLRDIEFRGVRGDEPSYVVFDGPWVRGNESLYIVNDGTAVSLVVRAGKLDVSLEWEESIPPEGWSGLRELVDELLRLAGPEAQPLRRGL